MSEIITAGMDVGSSSVKTVIVAPRVVPRVIPSEVEGPPAGIQAGRQSEGDPSTALGMTQGTAFGMTHGALGMTQGALGMTQGALGMTHGALGMTHGTTQVLAMRTDRIRRRDLRKVIEEAHEAALSDAGVKASDIAYLATTGEGELVEFRRGHFYGMTTHARGAIFLMPEARAALDIGALHARALRMDEKSRVLAYRMTSQCASGSGQFLENVARYLGITLEDIGPLSCSASDPELVSSICAVLAETDVINMVSRGIKTPDILKGIHVSMAGRYLKLLRSIGGEGTVAITGGLSADVGLAQALREKVRDDKMNMEIVTDPRAIYAGALGAALWGAYRHEVLSRRSVA